MANKENGNRDDSEIAVVMVPLPAQGHLNQLLNLSRILSAANIPVYYIGGATYVRQAKLRVHGGWDPSNIQFHELSTPSFNNPPPNPNSQTKFPIHLLPSFSASIHLRDPVYTFVNKISTQFTRVVLIFDSLMSYVVQDIDSLPNVESYCFRSISAFTTYSLYWEEAGRPDLPAEARILKDIRPPEGTFPPEFQEFISLQRGARKIFCGDLFNSSRAIEGLYLDLLAKEKKTGADRLWALGPFNPIVLKQKTESRMRHRCLEWLDEQEVNSVIFVSFGTTSSFSDEQIQQLAFGFESSGHKFIWVVRDADKGDIFNGQARQVELPHGFEERVGERGVVVRDWAPQLEILEHSSTGGFMSHCGWNSCSESISMGVPIAAWPMHTDQPGNAFLVTKVLGIGVEVVDWWCRDGVVSSEKVENAVRKLMGSEEGVEMRKRAQQLRVAVKDSMMKDGSNSKEMDSFITHITRYIQVPSIL